MRKKNRTYHKRGELVDGFGCRAHPIYAVWASMMSRCYSPNQPTYQDYGARGIKVDPSWHHFKNFAKDMGIRPGPEWTIERKDNNKGYEKSNCVWATRSDQCVNRRLFKNNSTGHRGVLRIAEDQWEASFQYLGITYRIGRYLTCEEARLAHEKFFRLFLRDRDAAVATITPKDQVVWNNAKTKVRGVCPHADGRGYLVRCTIEGVRYYVGYFKTVEEGRRARLAFIESYAREARSRIGKGQCG